MGVNNLWRLLLPIGRRISLESLEGKILAIDASIWLTQFVKAMRDKDTGRVQAAAHLIGFFRRLCRLRFHKIKPVFVFDGATPEIKRREVAARRRRREQFARELGDASVQRLAKQVLAQQLLKQKQQQQQQQKDGGAFASDFNPGAQREDGGGGGGERQQQKQEAQEKKQSDAAVSVMDVAASEEKDEDLVEKDDNDWDLPVREQAQDDDDDDKEENSDASWTEYDDDDDDDDDVDISYISSLPASQRKDAIEKAKRRQRLQSRKEFMPAAGDPLAFSQVQLVNFLRSSKLNQSIDKMAKQAIQKDNENQIGEVMASDRTRRVILIREDENNDDDKDDRKMPARNASLLLKKRPKRRRRKPTESSSDEEVEWEDSADYVVDGTNRSNSSPQRRRIIDDDESSDEDESNHESLSVRKRAAIDLSRSSPKTQKEKTIISIDSDDGEEDKDGGDGGFLKPTGSASARIRDTDGDTSQAQDGGFLKSETPSSIQASAGKPFAEGTDDQSDAVEGNGFLKSLPSHQGQAGAVLDQSQRGNPSDVAYAQELSDRFLAEALQKTEDAELIANASSATESVQGRKGPTACHSTVKPASEDNGAVVNAGSFANEKLEETDEEDDVDWEDGGVVNSCVADKGAKAEPASVELGNQDAILKDSEDEEDVDWEEGTSTVQLSDGEEMKREYVSEHIRNRSASSTRPAGVSADAFDFAERDHSTQPLLSEETTAALERAQATASNLANWAGLVFRRAMREVNAEDGRTSPRKKVEDQATKEIPNEHEDDIVVAVTNHASVSSRNERGRSNSPVEGSAEEPTARVNTEAEVTVQNPSTKSRDGTTNTTAAPAYVDASSMLLENEERWTAERNQREKEMDTVTDEMREEAMQLLQLFGVPYIEAPAEAEAQCAALEELGLVDGIVTEDSDVFVFGGKTVYKNIFEEQKYAEVYTASDAQREMSLGRNEMVALAMLLGGDYTEGVKGVGIVNGMEILETFDCSQSVKEGLDKFKRWLSGFDLTDAVRSQKKPGSKDSKSKEQIFHAKHKSARTRWSMPEGFPSDTVLQAYLLPVVDKSKERFSWALPDVENLMMYCNRNMGWRPEDTKRYLDPVVERLQNTLRQTRIDSFMKYEDTIKFADVRSKRLRDVLGLSTPSADGTQEVQKKRSRSNKMAKK